MTAEYAVIGNNVSKSKSPLIFKYLFDIYGIDAIYGYKEHRTLNNKTIIPVLKALSGANITSPYKRIAAEACDKLEGVAYKIGVVNTVVNREGALIGYNTDVDGVEYCLKETNCADILLIGAGGAANAAAQAVKNSGRKLFIANRTFEKADMLAKIYGGTVVEDFTTFDKSCLTIINTVPNNKFVIGILDAIKSRNITLIDAIYPQQIYVAHAKISHYIRGEVWLAAQAIKSFEIFTGIKVEKYPGEIVDLII